jgi:hypothetical protein
VSAHQSIIEHMFDRCPDVGLVADLVASLADPPAACADDAARSLIEELMAWQRVASWVEWHRLDTMRRFERARAEADRDLAEAESAWRQDLTVSQRAALRRLEGDLEDSAGRFAAEEIALALNMSVPSVDKQLRLAHDLHDVHRDLGEALELGQVSGFVAAMVAQATRTLPDETRRLLDPAVTSDAIEQPAGRAIDAARARTAELDVDADAAARRAARSRSVFMKPMDDAMAMLGAVMPAAEAVRAYRRLDDAARTHRSTGDPRTLDQLRCDELTALLAGATTGPQSEADDTVQPSAPGVAPTAVQVVIALTTLLGLDSTSAHLDGYGTISAGAARDIVAAGDFTLTRLLCNPDTGAVIHTDPTVYLPSDGLRHGVACRDRHCRMPVCRARIRHLDHIQARADAGLTTTDNLHGLCLRSHLAKHHPGWRVHGNADNTVTWTTPTRHEYTSHPPPATGYGTGPPGDPESPNDTPGWFSRDQRNQLAMRAWAERRRTA